MPVKDTSNRYITQLVIGKFGIAKTIKIISLTFIGAFTGLIMGVTFIPDDHKTNNEKEND